MKKVIFPIWVIALTGSLWVGCAKNGGGGGGGSSSQLQAIMACTNNNGCGYNQIYQALTLCSVTARNRFVDPAQSCAMVSSGGCPSFAQYVQVLQTSPEQLAYSGLPVPNVQGVQCNQQSGPDCSYQIIVNLGTYWATIVAQGMFCTPQDRSQIVSQLGNMTAQLSNQSGGGTYGGGYQQGYQSGYGYQQGYQQPYGYGGGYTPYRGY